VAAFSEHRGRLASDMERRGAWPSRSAWIRRAVDAVPRHDFAPPRLWRWDGHAYLPIDRETDADRWAAEVYGSPDAAAVTQVTDGLASSSLSCQGVVVDMLDSLLLEPGQRVLELGTGTGWNAALLTRRAGPGLVTSIEVDPALARQARARLSTAGNAVNVHVGDGGHGWPAATPYDRVIATYAVDEVPWSWVTQTRPGGRIVTPWGRLGHVALTVADDGHSASGWFQGLAQFMPARGAAATVRSFAQVRGTGPAQDERATARDLTPLRDNPHLLFALRVALPDIRITTGTDADGVNAWLHDDTSWASLSALGGGGALVFQGGPRRLAEEMEQAWDTWAAAGSPDVYDYGMTVTPDAQYVWAHDEITGPRWPAPNPRSQTDPKRPSPPVPN
jgi:protein-L-isoaspartate(D-aspartate) O-methyltransferase